MIKPDDYARQRASQAVSYARDEAQRALNAVIAAIAHEGNAHRKRRLGHVRDTLATALTELKAVM